MAKAINTTEPVLSDDIIADAFFALIHREVYAPGRRGFTNEGHALSAQHTDYGEQVIVGIAITRPICSLCNEVIGLHQQQQTHHYPAWDAVKGDIYDVWGRGIPPKGMTKAEDARYMPPGWKSGETRLQEWYETCVEVYFGYAYDHGLEVAEQKTLPFIRRALREVYNRPDLYYADGYLAETHAKCNRTAGNDCELGKKGGLVGRV